MNSSFKERLQYAMSYNNLRATDLCEKTATPKSAMSAYLSGKQEPRPERLFAIAKALDVSEAWLKGYDVEMARSVDQKETDALAAAVKRMSEDKAFQDLILRITSLNPQHLELVRNVVDALPQE